MMILHKTKNLCFLKETLTTTQYEDNISNTDDVEKNILILVLILLFSYRMQANKFNKVCFHIC